MNKALTIIWTIALIVSSFSFATVVTQNQAERMAQYAAKHEAIKVGRCSEIVLLHDIKKIVEYDFGD